MSLNVNSMPCKSVAFMPCLSEWSLIEATHIRFLYSQEYMPLPPAEEENGENTTPSDEPKLDFSTVECLMYTFHQLAAQKPDFLTADVNNDRLKDFRLRYKSSNASWLGKCPGDHLSLDV